MYKPIVETRLDPRGKPYYWINGELYKSHRAGSDGYSLSNLNKTSITPIKIDQTASLKDLEDFLDI